MPSRCGPLLVVENHTCQRKNMEHLSIVSGEIIATSHDLTPNGGLVREISLFQGNLGWWNIIIWPDCFNTFFVKDLQWVKVDTTLVWTVIKHSKEFMKPSSKQTMYYMERYGDFLTWVEYVPFNISYRFTIRSFVNLSVFSESWCWDSQGVAWRWSEEDRLSLGWTLEEGLLGDGFRPRNLWEIALPSNSPKNGHVM